jgi:hypothetical protein
MQPALSSMAEISSVHDETFFLALSQLNEGCSFSSSTKREQECSKVCDTSAFL